MSKARFGVRYGRESRGIHRGGREERGGFMDSGVRRNDGGFHRRGRGERGGLWIRAFEGPCRSGLFTLTPALSHERERGYVKASVRGNDGTGRNG